MNPKPFLETMKQLVRERVKQARLDLPLEAMLNEIERSPKPLNFCERIGSVSGPKIIAEIKRQSPTKGNIATDLPVSEVAEAYQHRGAAAISVLTEPTHFGGSVLDLAVIRGILPDMPLLMKDFVLDSYQLVQARYFGADAVLLICSFLEEDRIHELYSMALKLGLTPLVEVHTESELAFALNLGARAIGVNNRDLNTLKIDLTTTKRLASRFDLGSALFIAESGIETPDQIRSLSQMGYAGFLIGTKLMADKNPGLDLSQLIEGSR
jgi:indole-3-glycerol phosphate synthase